MSGQHSVGETVCAKKCYVFPTSRDFFLFNLGLAPLFQTSLLTAASETNDTIKKYKQPTATVIVHLFFKISVQGLFHIKCRRFEESWAFQWGISDLRSNPKNNDWIRLVWHVPIKKILPYHQKPPCKPSETEV